MQKYAQPLQAFAVAVAEYMRENHKLEYLEKIVAAAQNPMTKTQATMLVADLLEWNQDLAGMDLVALDKQLSERGLPSFTLMRRKQDREFASTLSRGFIASDDEWRLVNSRLSDVDNPLAPSDRALANQMLVDYESEGTA